MKPSFALSLSQDGVALYRRTAGEWALVGTANPESDDFDARMRGLRAEAGTSGDPVTTKLVLPNSQLLYTEVETSGPDRATRRAGIAKALEGRTPYPLDDLVFDWSGTGSRVQVAVVARVTLDEAEAFAETYGFAPVSFVAAPEDGRFAGEPWFGTTSRAGDHVAPGDRVERDQDPVRARPGATLPPASVEPEPEAAPEPVVEPTPEAVAEAEAAHESEAAAVAADEIAPPDEAPFIAIEDDESPFEDDIVITTSVPDEATEIVPVDEPVAAEASAPVVTDEQAEDPALPPEVETALDAALAEAVEADTEAEATQADTADVDGTEPESLASAETEAVTVPDVAAEETADQAEAATDDVVAAPVATVADAPELVTPDPAPAADSLRIDAPVVPDLSPAAAPALPFASRRRRGAKAAQRDRVPPPLSRDAGDKAESAAPDAAPAPILAAPQPKALPEAAVPTLAAPQRPFAAVAEGAKPVPPHRPAHGPVTSGATRKTILRRVLSRASAAKSSPKPLRSKPKSPADEAAELTVFGARRTAEVGGKPRYLGVMLTALLVALMAAAALMPTLFGGNDTAPQGTAASGDTGAITAPDASTDAAAAGEGEDVFPPAETADTDEAPVEEPVAEEPAPEPEATAEPEPAPAAEDETLAAASGSEGNAAAATDPAAVAATAAAVAAAAALADGNDEASQAASEADAPAATAPEADATTVAEAPAGTASVWGAAPGTAADSDSSSIRRDPGDALPPADAGALPETAGLAADAAPSLDAPPVPFGSLMRLGPDGLIVATPDGVVSPAGFTIFAGRPPLVPDPRPEGLVPAAVAPTAPVDPAASPDAATTEPAEAPPLALPGIPDTRPLPRPGNLAPEDDAAVAPDTVAPAPAGPVDPRHAALKPRVRPGIIEARVAQRDDTEAAFAAAAAAAATGSELAVASSQRPSSRPSSISAAAVEAALAAAVAEPSPEVQVAAAAPAPEPEPEPEQAAPAEEVDEPEPTSAAPDIPTRASVAKQATIKNALDLGKINLIGVYGSSGDRRALVRTTNGRFVRVKVGDRLDGGKVAAIGETELSYVKNGRTIVLKMIRDS